MFASENGFTATDRTMVIGPNNFSHVESCCSEAKASDPKDEDRILSALRENDENLENINKLVKEYRMHGYVGHEPSDDPEIIPSPLHSPTYMPWKRLALLIVLAITWPKCMELLLGFIDKIRPRSSNFFWCNFLQLNDSQLWQMAVHGRIGSHCLIYVSPPGSSNACQYYVKGRMGIRTYRGVPRNVIDLGTGCVQESGSTFCWYMGAEYAQLTNAERESMCTDSIMANAAAQLRYGIRNGYCGVDSKDRCVE